MAEFALILPVMLLIAVAVGDFGRIYATIVTLESAVREAADYGAFSEANWLTPSDAATTEAEMQHRACTASRHLPGYAGALDDSTCTNPQFVWFYEVTSNPAGTMIVGARATYMFETAVSFPPLPDSVTLVREARFAVMPIPAPEPGP